jgi:putative CocE/NonD family hydrolase
MNVELRLSIKVPMRDGIHLNACVYVPKPIGMPNAIGEPAPCVLMMTPYTADLFHDRGMRFAELGIPSVVMDVRGRGDSEGAFRPYIQEAYDGYDAVQWLAHQSYCNGQVAMCGGSYLGYCQWATAKEFPPHLATIVPAASPFLGVDFPMRKNIFFPSVVRWIALTSGRTSQMKLYSDDRFWSRIFRRWCEAGQPFRDLARSIGVTSGLFEEWVSHPVRDTYWDAYNPTTEEYARLRIPILTITGSYDDDQPGALEHYREHCRSAPPDVRAMHFLIIGPWDHAGVGVPRADFGGIRVGEASVIDMSKLHRDWYSWTMQDGPRPAFLQNSVAYYVIGGERWRYAETLEAVTESHQPYFLDSSGSANDVFSAGSLGGAPGTGHPDSYTYDPRDTTGPELDAEEQSSGDSLIDQRLTVALRGRQLIYHSAPFETDTEISGFFKLDAWISLTSPDSDLYVSVHVIDMDNGSVRLSTDAIRARYREGLRAAKLIRTDAPLLYEFRGFTFISYLVKRGCRLRLIIAPLGRLIEATFVEKNYNAGGIVAEESSDDARAVTVSLFHDRNHPSALYIPLGRAEPH